MCVGVFKPMEPLGAVRQFISDCLLDPSRQYKLSFMRTQLCENTDRLAQLGLVSIVTILIIIVVIIGTLFHFVVAINLVFDNVYL